MQQAVSVAAVTLCLCLAGPAAPALAHVELQRAEPAAGAVLDEPPVEVYLRFTGQIEEGSATIRVRGPGGDDVTAGDTQSGGRAAAVDLVTLTDNGVYRVRYEGVSTDSHTFQGRLRFRLRLAPPSPTDGATSPSTPATTPSPTADAQPPSAAPTASPAPELTREFRTVPWWPFAVLLGVAALVGVTLFRRR